MCLWIRNILFNAVPLINATAVSLLFTRFFVSNVRLKLAKNQANAKQRPEDEVLLFENYSQPLSKLSFKNNSTYSKK